MTGQQSTLADDDAVARIQRVPVPGWGPLDGDPGGADPPLPAPAGVADTPGWSATPGRPPGGGHVEPGADWPHAFARMLVETLAGTRPARQILPWTTTRARSQFDRLLRGFGGPGAAGAGRPVPGKGAQPRVMRVVATRPASDVIEMSVIAGFGARVRALALRLERPQGEASARTRRPPWPDAVLAASSGWICTDIEAA